MRFRLFDKRFSTVEFLKKKFNTLGESNGKTIASSQQFFYAKINEPLIYNNETTTISVRIRFDKVFILNFAYVGFTVESVEYFNCSR